MSIPSIDDDLEIFRRFNLPLSHEVAIHSEAYKKACMDVGALLGVMCFEQGWSETGQKNIGRLVAERFLPPASSGKPLVEREVEAQVRMAHALYLYRLVDGKKSYSQYGIELETIIGNPTSHKYAALCGVWHEYAYPKVVISDMQASSLMAMTFPIKEISTNDIIPPWPCFIVELPNTVLTYMSGRGTVEPVDRLFVYSTIMEDGRRGWRVLILAGIWDTITIEGLDFFSDQVALKALEFQDENPEEAAEYDAYQKAVTGASRAEVLQIRKQNRRLFSLVTTFVANLCLALSDKSRLIKMPAESKLGKIQNKVHIALRLAPTQAYKLGLPVKVDVREKIRDYVEHKRGTAPKVRFLVRGHWKSIPYGPNNSLRKWGPIESYWKGEGPVLLRQHELKGLK